MNGTQPEPRDPASAHGTGPADPGAETQDARTLELAAIIEQYLARLDAGERPDRTRILAANPDLADDLANALAGLDLLRQSELKPSLDVHGPPTQLGDFRILREVGRGGMGVVYEAEQISLKRRVALKVLRLGPVADDTALQRFQREAETIARLHHTNIVPIHAIGCEQGVQYYAMQFIDGADLAQCLQPSRQGGSRPSVENIVQWGLQAAEALAHAHERGVIHRDIKPSNLILDREGRIWLTDFGLARRHDDISLSLSGALLGTPRYMSPEQASAASRSPVDHRTDVYSLGATLYELATGQPIFDAPSPHQVIAQILHQEPRAPRRIIADLPRDLETVILKCLSKEPAQRYATAAELADDLRALREHRPIAARRVSRTERTLRWLRHHRRAVALAATSAAAALILAALGLAGWSALQRRNLGRLQLSSSQPNLLAEVLDAQGQTTILPPASVPLEPPPVLPAGHYQLRLSSPGIPSESWAIEVRPGELTHQTVALPPRWLWPPQTLGPAGAGNVERVRLRAHADLLAVLPPDATDPNLRLRLLRGTDGRPAWKSDLVFDESTRPQNVGNLEEWRTVLGRWSIAPAFADTGLPDRCADLDRDGVGDPVILSRTSASLVAVSGATGQILWWHRGYPELPSGTSLQGTWLPAPQQGAVVGTPLQTPLDGDDIPDLVACFRTNHETYRTPNGRAQTIAGQSWVGAVSGRDGSLIWRQPLPDAWANYASSSSDAERFGPLAAPRRLTLNRQAVIVLTTQGRLAAWNARTGEPVCGPLDPGFEITQPPLFVETQPSSAAQPAPASPPRSVNRNGESRVPNANPDDDSAFAITTQRLGDEPATLELAALRLPSGTVAWRRTADRVPAHLMRTLQTRTAQRQALLANANHSAPSLALLVQHVTDLGPHSLEVQCLTSSTGTPHWTQVLSHTDQPAPVEFAHVAATEDSDGDGTQDLLATFLAYDADAKKHGVQAVLLSGATGQSLWSRHYHGFGGVTRVDLWRLNPDRPPSIILSTSRREGGRESTLVLDPRSGAIAHTLPGVSRVWPGDLDGDDIEDLAYTLPEANAPRWVAVPGRPSPAWRQLGAWQAAGDCDNDGIHDFIGLESDRLTVRSGTNGKRLWSTADHFATPNDIPTLRPGSSWPGTPAGPFVFASVRVWVTTNDVEKTPQRTYAAFDRTTGRRAWIASGLELGTSSRSGGTTSWAYDYPYTSFADLDHDGFPELLAAYSLNGNLPRLTVVNGKDGQVRLDTRIIDGAFSLDPRPAGMPLADFNRDGTLDVALILPPSAGNGHDAFFRAQVLDGHTGQPLWSEPAPLTREGPAILWPEPTLGDLDGDGVPEVVVHVRSDQAEPLVGYRCELRVLDGRTGTLRWSWTWNSGSPEIWPAVFLRRSGLGNSLLAFATSRRNDVAIQILDAAGQLRAEHALPQRPQAIRSGAALWHSVDLDGDGDSELIARDGDRILAFAGPNLTVKHRWKTAPEGETVRAFLRSIPTPTPRLELVVWQGKDILAIDGPSGQAMWRGHAPTTPVLQLPNDRELQFIDLGPSHPRPGLLFGPPMVSDDSTTVHTTWRCNPNALRPPP